MNEIAQRIYDNFNVEGHLEEGEPDDDLVFGYLAMNHFLLNEDELPDEFFRFLLHIVDRRGYSEDVLIHEMNARINGALGIGILR